MTWDRLAAVALPHRQPHRRPLSRAIYGCIRTSDRPASPRQHGRPDRKSHCAGAPRPALFLSAHGQTCPLVASPGGRYSHPRGLAASRRGNGRSVEPAGRHVDCVVISHVTANWHTHAHGDQLPYPATTIFTIECEGKMKICVFPRWPTCYAVCECECEYWIYIAQYHEASLLR